MKSIRVLDSHAVKRCLLVFLAIATLAAVGLTRVQPVTAQFPGIISPRDNAVVAGSVAILGTATHPEFWKYELYFSPMFRQEWTFVGQVHETAVVNGQLEIWHTHTVSDGAYELRLRVVRRDGNYDEYFVRNISVSNLVPTATPTLEATPTRALTTTPLPATPTIIVEQPSLPTPTPKATANPSIAPETTVEPTAANSPPSALSVEGLSNAACYGGALAGGVFLLMVILALLRQLVSLLLSRL